MIQVDLLLQKLDKFAHISARNKINNIKSRKPPNPKLSNIPIRIENRESQIA